jgi:hypothetical protein
MKDKILIIIGAAVVMSLIVVVSLTTHRQKQHIAEGQNELATATSNFHRMFKLNTNAPIWVEDKK